MIVELAEYGRTSTRDGIKRMHSDLPCIALVITNSLQSRGLFTKLRNLVQKFNRQKRGRVPVMLGTKLDLSVHTTPTYTTELRGDA